MWVSKVLHAMLISPHLAMRLGTRLAYWASPFCFNKCGLSIFSSFGASVGFVLGNCCYGCCIQTTYVGLHGQALKGQFLGLIGFGSICLVAISLICYGLWGSGASTGYVLS